jgi:hypothetical protein
MNEGRKRIDIVWPNVSDRGFFAYLRENFAARHIFAECKNYSKDISNPEVDQLLERFAPWSTQAGFLICRKVTNRKLLDQRCRDAFHAGRGLVIALDDDDLEALAALDTDPDWGEGSQSNWLLERLQRIAL